MQDDDPPASGFGTVSSSSKGRRPALGKTFIAVCVKGQANGLCLLQQAPYGKFI